MRKFYDSLFIALTNKSKSKRKSIKLVVLVFAFLVANAANAATTYYLSAAGQGSAQTLTSWHVNANGTGASPANFTTDGDIFNVPVGINGTFGVNTAFGSGSASGSGVTIQILGSITISNGVTITLNGKNSNQSSITVSGTIIFGATAKVSLNDNNAAMSFTLSSGATLKTANVFGVLGASCSIERTAGANPAVNLSTSANYEFNGTVSQATLGLPATVNTLTINNAIGVNLTAAVSVTTLNIGNVTTSSIFNDNGKQVTSTGTFNLTSGTFNIGNGALNTSYPAFTTNTIVTGTTVNYASTAAQTIAAVNYGSLINTGNGPRTLASPGIIGIKNVFTPSTNLTSTIIGSTVAFNGSSAQTIPVFNYNNLTVTNTNTNITLANSGAIGIAGIFTPNATSFGTITNSTVIFNGTLAQTIPQFTFNNLTIANAAGISSIGGDVIVNQSLQLTSGIVTTGSNKITNNGSSNSSGGWVYGNLQKYFTSVNNTSTFQVGGSAAGTYRPVTINFSSVTTAGYLNITQVAGPHTQIATSGINPYLTPYWNLASGGVAGTYDATFTFIAADATSAGIGSPAAMVADEYSSSTWLATTIGTRTGATNQATGLTTFGDFCLGTTTGIPQVTTQPSNSTICAGSNTSFTAASTSKPTPTVKWQRSLDGGTTWIDITANLDAGVTYSNFTTNTLNLTGATSAVNGYKYRPVYTNLNGSSTNAAPATLTITTPPSATISYTGSPYGATDNTSYTPLLTGTTGGTYTASAGLTVNASTGALTPSANAPGTYTVTYTVAAFGGCSVFTTTATVKITNAPTAIISYAGNPFCQSVTTAQPVTITGTGNYTNNTSTAYTAAPAGLTIDGTTGAIIPSTSTAGTYTVTYNIPADNPYPPSTTTTQVTITAMPTATISYAATSFCTGDASPNPVTLTGTGAYTGGIYSASPLGLSLDANTGDITPSLSSGTVAGTTYTVTYTVPASGGCSIVTTSTSVIIIKKANGSISYSQPSFCQSITMAELPTLISANGSGTFSSSPAGLTIDPSTGNITPSTSTAGDYTVTYTFSNGTCGTVQYTTDVSIVASPTGSIDYAGQPFCQAGSVKPVTLTGTGNYTGGTFSSSPSGLTLDANTGDITPVSSSPNTYTVTYTTPGCPVQFTTTVEITAAPNATISYAQPAFCQSDGSLEPCTITGDMSGTFSALSGLSIDPNSGAITPSTSTAGTYTVSYTIAAQGTCGQVIKTTSVKITASPTANIFYAGTPFCTSLTTAQGVTLTGTNAYTGGAFSSTAGLTINSGNGGIIPSSSTAGNYTVTYSTLASGGCSAVQTTAPVTITQLPAATISYSATSYCTSDLNSYPVNYSATTGAYSGGTFSTNPATGLSIDASGTITPSTSTPGTYIVSYDIPASGGCSDVITTTSVTINTPATINTQPSTASQTVCAGGTVTAYSVAATGTGLTYQWFSNTVNSNSGGTLISGATNATYTPQNTVAGTLYYYVVVNGTCMVSVTSNVSGAVTINALPSISVQPSTATQTVCQNGSATALTVTAGGAGLSYQWYSNTTASNSGGTLVSGATVSSYTPSTTTPGTLYYYVIVSGTCSPPVTSNVSGAITINALPSISVQPSTTAQNICLNGTATALTVTAGGTGITYQWYKNAANSNSGGTLIGGATASSYTPPTTTAGTLYYYVVVTGTCSPPATSNVSGAITVSAVSVGGTLSPASSTPLTICAGANSGTITLSGNTGTVVQWETSVNGGSTWTNIGNAGNTSLNYLNITQTTLYRVLIQSSPCSSIYSGFGQLVVLPAFTPTITPSATLVCVNSSITLTASGYSSTGLVISGGDFGSGPSPTGWKGMSGNASNNSGGSPSNNIWGWTNGGSYNTFTYNSTPSGSKFMIANGITATNPTSLETPVFSTIGMSSAVLIFNEGYNLNAGASIDVEISTNGGTTYPTKLRSTISGPAGPYFTNGLSGTVGLDLNAYLGLSNLRIRFKYTGSAGSDWALDNVVVSNIITNTTGTNVYNPLHYTWTPTTYLSAPNTNTTTPTVTVTPTAAGSIAYTVSASVGTCAASSSSAPVTITFNPLPTITPAASAAPVCFSSSAQTSTLAYSSPTNSPTTYSITWNSVPANSFVTVTNATLNASPITINVPANTAAGTYTGTLTVKNSNGCSSSAGVSFTITVNAAATVSTPSSSSIQCLGSATLINATASNVSSYQWQLSTDGGSTWNTLTNTSPYSGVNTNSLGISATDITMTGYTYKLNISGISPCASIQSGSIPLRFTNEWLGTADRNWSNASNWVNGVLPSYASCGTVVIPAVPNLPQLSGNVTTTNLAIASSANLDLNGKILQIDGIFTGSNTAYLKSNSSSGLIINGNATSLYFDTLNNYLKTFTINSAKSATLGNALNIAAGTYASPGTLTTDGILNANGNLTIKSDINGDARIAQSTGSITGDVTVERFILGRRAWRFVSGPFSSSNQTVHDAWQEGVNNYGLDYNTYNQNPHPGYGTHITGNNFSNMGYDFNTTVNPSYKVWDPNVIGGGGWSITEPPTISTHITDYPAYCLFVRGSRAVNLSLGTNAPFDNTVLRIKGGLNETGLNIAKNYPGISNGFVFIGNPYASSINMQTILDGTRGSGFSTNKLWVWDPKLGGNYGVGGYVTFASGVWAPNDGSDVGSSSYPSGTGNLPIIQSGQGFMLQLNSGSSAAGMTYSQNDKIVSESNVTGKVVSSTIPVVYTNLTTPSHEVIDGVATVFDNQYSARVDSIDAKKFWNFNENMALVRHDTSTLAIEFRPTLVLSDTLFYKMYLYKNYSYALQLFTYNANKMPLLRAWIVDKYLNTKTEVNMGDTIFYNFTTNTDTNSYRNRFMLVMKRQLQTTPVPVSKTTNLDDPNITGVANSMASTTGSITLYPSAVTEARNAMLKFSRMKKGNYEITVYSIKGQKLYSQKIQDNGGINLYPLQGNSMWAAGIYTITVLNEELKKITTLKLLVSK